MDFTLTEEEARVLGSLMEKEMSAPEYYPLSLNALTNACNQKSSRDPVVNYDEITVARAVEGLKDKQLVYEQSGARVAKYGANLANRTNLINRETAPLCLLMLRGPQTLGEMKSRTERMYTFQSIDEVREAMASLADLGFTIKLPRRPGQKESRYAHLLAGGDNIEQETAPVKVDPAVARVRADNDRVAELENQVAELKQELAELKAAFLEFKGQFE